MAPTGRHDRPTKAGENMHRKRELVRASVLRSRKATVTVVCFVSAALVGVGGASTAMADDCPNAAYRVGSSAHLPDCRAYEMVSAPDKAQANASLASAIADDGNRVQLLGEGKIGDSASNIVGGYNSYLANRGASGWVVTSMQPPGLYSSTGANHAADDALPDLSQLLWLTSTQSQFGRGESQIFSAGLDGSFDPISPVLAPTPAISTAKLGVQGASTSFQHIVVTTAATQASTLLPGDPTVLNGAAGNLYEVLSGGATVRLVQRDSAGLVIGGACGAVLGSAASARHAVSDDGSTIYFSARPGAGATCTGPNMNTFRNRVFARTDGTTTTQVSQSQCARVSPACSTAAADDQFEAASADGTRVYVSTPRQLTDSDTDATKDLYLYDFAPPSGQPNLVQVSKGDATAPTPGAGAAVQGVVAFSEDGSRTYFVAHSILTTTANPAGDVAQAGEKNLYVFERDDAHPTGRIAFVGTMGLGDTALWNTQDTRPAHAVPNGNADADGHTLVFLTSAKLRADDSDTAQDLYRYDDSAGTLERVSADTGDIASGNSEDSVAVAAAGSNFGSRLSQASFRQRNRAVTEDGGTVLFATTEPLDPAHDSGSTLDVYRWHAGKVAMISDGSGLPIGVTGNVSRDGDEMFFETRTHLLPQDGDTATDLYVARIGGGFPLPEPPPDCVEDECQERDGFVPMPADPGLTDALGNRPLPLPTFSVMKPTTRSVDRWASTGKLVLRLTASESGRLATTATALVKRRTSRVAYATRTVTNGGTVDLTLKLTKSARAELRRVGRLRIRLVTTYSKNAVADQRTLSVRSAKRRSTPSATSAHRG